MKRGRFFLRIVLTGAVVVSAVVEVWPREKEPVYQGKRLSEWIRDDGNPGKYALGKFGTEARPAVPCLIDCLHDPNQSVRDATTNALKHVSPEVLEKR